MNQRNASPDGGTEPIRDVIFSLERLEGYAKELAVQHTLTPDPRRGRGVSGRLRDNARVLLATYQAIVRAVQAEEAVTPAAEWLLDNFYVVDEQLREIVQDLPEGFYRKLPKLASGPLELYPRVFGLAWEFVAHTDSRFDTDSLTHFIAAYQQGEQGQALEIGELWALPITLRLVLVENLRRLTQRMAAARLGRQSADLFADDLLGLNERPQQPLEVMRYRLQRLKLSRSFVVQLTQRMRDQADVTVQVMYWLEELLAENGTQLEEAVAAEYQAQGASNVTVRNIITSMRLISAVDWAVFFESVSVVNRVLNECPSFAQSDFTTRNRYRHAVEELARGSDYSEVEIARFAVQLASREKEDAGAAIATSRGSTIQDQSIQDQSIQDQSIQDQSIQDQSIQDSTARANNSEHDSKHYSELEPLPEPDSYIEVDRQSDSGYYLISSGRRLLERTVGFRVSPSKWFFRIYHAGALPGYLGTITLVAMLILFVGFLTFAPRISILEGIFLLLLVSFPASDLALALVNDYVTRTFKPRPLPKLELKEGVPENLRTMIVVPTLLTSHSGALEELERLEVRYLANSSGDLRFALLSDFADADAETLPTDQPLLDLTYVALRELNLRYGPTPSGESRFLLYHRRRIWSESEQTWMGWERKRGKLHEFNRLLRGANNTSFVSFDDGPFELPAHVRFIITLDADTGLPRGAARRLVGAMAHPLNRPRFDLSNNKVPNKIIEGYALLQPRITLSLPAEREGTVFQSVFSSHAGMDPYASAVSDVYQDLFGEGSYSGKGIYDIDAFEQALEGRIPETALLSHDLFEGLFARAGLISDVELIEEYPSHYGVRAARQHRWVRGDWQLLPWVFSARAPISTIGRWKLLDNLRRSLSPIAVLLALLGGWVLPNIDVLSWTGFILAILLLPMLMPFFAAVNSLHPKISRRSYTLALSEKLSLSLAQFALTLTFLADQSWQMCDAIGRTLNRVFVTKQNMLEWRTAAQAKATSKLELVAFYRQMIGAPILAGICMLLVALLRPESAAVALPFVVLWLLSPFVALWASKYRPSQSLERLTFEDKVALRKIARRTWRFFERFVGPEDHYLPPDNFQEDPFPKIAHRTSPTNIGLLLLSTVSANDFGWIGIVETVERLELSLDTLERLEFHQGHLYNWYDTQTLQPLEPRYVSTVDSGNLAGHLITFSQACLELAKYVTENITENVTGNITGNITGTVSAQEISTREGILDGVRDALNLALAASTRVPSDQRSQTVNPKQLGAALGALEQGLNQATTHLNTESKLWAQHLFSLEVQANTLLDVAGTLISERSGAALPAEVASDLSFWVHAVRNSLQSHIRDLTRLENEHAITNTDSPLPIRLERLAARSEALFKAMKFGFLFDDNKKLFSIGFDISSQHLDPSYYDLLASEARLTSFIAIAKDEIPTAHWFHLGRELTPIYRSTALVSWSGSMFEYLMPRLVMHSPPGSLLEETCCLAVRAQMGYGMTRSAALQSLPSGVGGVWGISESAFAARDLAQNYQYMAFGVPGLGLKRGLGDDFVIAPYASALAALFDPVAATRNLARLERIGASGAYGFYDAVDFTPSRQPEGSRFTVVRNFMAHHSGMTLVALANVLHGDRMTARFHADVRMQSAELLLQERTPRAASVARPRSEEVLAARAVDSSTPGERSFGSMREAALQTHLLSNGRYTVMLSAVGSGYSRWNDRAVTRWREDTTQETQGSFIYLRSLPDERGIGGRIWSATPQPLGLEPAEFQAKFYEERAEFFRRDGVFSTLLEVIVSAEDDAEIRRVTVTNHSSKTRDIEVTSYAEVVLTTPSADDAHPAFSKLFVQTECVASLGALLATRRPRSPDEATIWAAHTAVVEGSSLERTNSSGNNSGNNSGPRASDMLQYETDRARFLGRGQQLNHPAAIMDGLPLSNTVGAVLDPIFSLRRRIRLEPGASASVTFTTLVAATRQAALEGADRYSDSESFARGLTMAWTYTQGQLHHLGISPLEGHIFQQLASNVLYLNPKFRPVSEVLTRNTLGQSSLWRFGISGDLPIILLRIDDANDLEIVRQLLRAHEYLRTKRLAVDLVILNEQATSYMQELQESILNVIRSSLNRANAPLGSIYTLRADLLSSAEQDLLKSTARVVLLSRLGTLTEQVARSRTLAPLIAKISSYPIAPPSSHTLGYPINNPSRRTLGNTFGNPISKSISKSINNSLGNLTKNSSGNSAGNSAGNSVGNPSDNSMGNTMSNPVRNSVSSLNPLTATLTRLNPTRRPVPAVPNPISPDLDFFNGLGGFSRSGLEYQITLGQGQWTPTPWVNVIANPNIGFTISEAGSGYTWAQNSRENKLTPWSNDPVSDSSGEVLYIRDEETFEVFCATPLPIRDDSSVHTIFHGQGYTSFSHQTHGLQLELTQFVAPTDPVKISRLTLENRSGKPRKLSVTGYLEWVLGVSREASAAHIITEVDSQTGAIFARNFWTEEFAQKVAFVDLMVQWQAGKNPRFTCDRREFIGRHGTLERPAALQPKGRLGGKVGAGFDPCAALQNTLELAVGAKIEVVFLLGQTDNPQEAQRLIQTYRNADISAVLDAVKHHWDNILGTVQVSTPDTAMNHMLNRWLPYQTLSSRIWARSGFYQAGGAYGFRDQLQDTMSLSSIQPGLAREQILRAASRQFLEGDVQHWWHPPSGRGVRTHISDDLVWLPYCISSYLETSSDSAILEELVGFIEGPPLAPEHEDSYFTPVTSPFSATLFEHGARALERSLAVGVHGLPLIGSGDWNDGMNRVGREGKGESVWLGWFLHTNLIAWANLAERRGELERARVWREHAAALQTSLETHAWDGEWYKRAFYDDGTPLGSAQSDECQIDAIAQSWAVISGAADPTRAKQAMNSLEQHLINRADRLMLLFTPPFQNTSHDPGYIKGYLPGVRENGGQYTHAAVWSVVAFALLGDGNKAFELFGLLNPINRSSSRAGVQRYKVEPYVLSADVYAQEPHVGRGGWTWYTGSSGWLYRAGLESILGFKRRGTNLEIDPCIPTSWKNYQITFKYHSSSYTISVENPQGVAKGVVFLELDGQQVHASSVPLWDDQRTHHVRVVMGLG